jgi:hypothetical protein
MKQRIPPKPTAVNFFIRKTFFFPRLGIGNLPAEHEYVVSHKDFGHAL